MSVSSLAHTLANSALLRDLPAESLERLASVARRRTYRRGQVIVHEGDPGDSLYVLESGRVKVLSYAGSGRETIFDILGPGECFGELSLIDGQPRSATVETLEPVEAAVLQRSDFLDVVRSNTECLDHLLTALTSKIRQLSETVTDLAFLDLEGRLAKKLLELAAEHGREAEGAIEIELPITQEELAAMIGATRTTVNELLGRYEARQAIARRGRRIAILDQALLRRRIIS
jgi:CRP-like cAMP-binding protein